MPVKVDDDITYDLELHATDDQKKQAVIPKVEMVCFNADVVDRPHHRAGATLLVKDRRPVTF